MDDKLEQRIKEETAKIKVDSYQKTASIGGWAGGGRTLWAISVVGAAAGALVGLVAPFFPMLVLGVAAQPALAIVGLSTLVFAATGMATGFGGGLMLGRTSGSAAAVGAEQEKRLKQWMIRQKLIENPQAEILPDAPVEKPAEKSLKEKYYEYINPRIGLVMAAIGVVGGLIAAAAFFYSGGAAGAIMPGAIAALTGVKTAAAAATLPVIASYFGGVMGAVGALWAFNFPKITSETTEFFGNLIGGKYVGRKWEAPKPEKSEMVALPKTILSKEPAQQQPAVPQKESTETQDMALATTIIQEVRATKKPFGQSVSYQEMVTQQPADTELTLKR